MDLNPPRIRYIKGSAYTVQPGDDVTSIASHYRMPCHRWPELVGANPHKPATAQGYRYRCFDRLEAGEPLNVPACWREPQIGGAMGSPGMVGAVDTLELFKKAVDFVKKYIPVTFHDKFDQLAAVIYSWWPHLDLPELPKAAPTAQQQIEDLIKNGVLTEANWALLFTSANEFLKATGLGQGDSPKVQNIPWGDIPWLKLSDIWQRMPNKDWARLSSILANMINPQYTTPPVIKTMSLQQSQVPNFLDPTTWNSSTYAAVPFKDMTWSDTLTEVLKDPRFIECAKTKPVDRMAKVSQWKDCYNDAKSFVDLYCSDIEDQTKCPKPEPKKDEPPKPEAKEEKSNAMTYALIGVGAVGLIALISSLKS